MQGAGSQVESFLLVRPWSLDSLAVHIPIERFDLVVLLFYKIRLKSADGEDKVHPRLLHLLLEQLNYPNCYRDVHILTPYIFEINT